MFNLILIKLEMINKWIEEEVEEEVEVEEEEEAEAEEEENQEKNKKLMSDNFKFF